MSKVDRNNVEDILLLTSAQAGMLFHTLRHPGSDHYVVQLALRLGGAIDRAAFEGAWQAVVDANEMLRTVFRWEESAQPVQIVLKTSAPEVQYFDLDGRTGADVRAAIDGFMARDRRAGFDLRRVPFRVALFALGGGAHELVVSYHTIVCDGWSSAIVVGEFLAAYTRLARGAPADPPPKARVKDFLKWRLASASGDEAAYWMECLRGVQPAILSIDGADTSEPNASARLVRAVPAELAERAARFARERRVTLSMLLYGVWAVLLARYTDADEVVFGTTVAGRPPEIPGIDRTVGSFINTPPLRLTVRAGDSFGGVVASVERALAARRDHEWTAAVEIQRAAGLAPGADLFNTIVVVENYPVAGHAEPDAALTIGSYSFVDANNYDFTLLVRAFDGLALELAYRADRCRERDVARLGGHLLALLDACLDRPDAPLGSIDMLTAEERRALDARNATARPYAAGATLAHLLLEAAEVHAGREALVCGDERLTYGELDARVEAMAAHLQELGVGRGRMVAVLVDRSVAMAVAVFGILRAGGCYVPLSKRYPAARTGAMLRDCAAAWLVVDASALHDLDYGGAVIDVSAVPASRRAPGAALPRAEDPAYVIYTSGSTGVPKGVVVPHRAVVNLVSWMQHAFELGPGDAVLQSTPLPFDVSVWEMFAWIPAGGRMCLLAPGAEQDPAAMAAAVARHGATAMHLVPSMLPAFLDHLEAHGAADMLASLRLLFSSGEPLRGGVARRVRDLLGRSGRLRHFSNYGPTETTVWTSSHLCTPEDDAAGILPIGPPFDNTTYHVLGRQGQPQPIGVWGELHIGGDGLALGYLNRPELTAERFFTSPAAKGARVYRSGDITRWTADGEMQIKGRRDAQVKIRGHRIELGDVETHLLAIEGVTAAAVVVRDAAGGDPQLVAYYASQAPKDPRALHDALAGRLPGPMVPARFVRVESLPLTPNGKVDVRALPDTDVPPAPRPPAVVEDEALDALREALAEVLGTPTAALEPDASFFHLGGNSISAVRLTSALFRRLGVKVALAEVFEHPTVSALADVVRRARKPGFAQIPRAEAREYYELSYVQKRLWIVQELNPGTASYNLVGRLELHHAVEPREVAAALNALVGRHESLRTRFTTVKGAPVQIVSRAAPVRLVVQDLSARSPAEQQAARQQFLMRESLAPFDLTRPPLLRTTLLKLGDEHYELVVNVPHIVTDGWSLDVLKDEFERILYGGGAEQVPMPAIQYKDYAAWHNRLLRDSAQVREARRFWGAILAREAPDLLLPDDFPDRAPGAERRSAAYRTVVPAALADRVRDWSREQQIGRFLPQAAALALTMAHVTGQDDIVVGFVAAARQHESIRGTTGLFANTLVLRAAIDRDQRVADFRRALQDQVVQALEHQTIPLELVCDELHVRFPRLGAFLNVLNLGTEYRVPLTDLSSYHIPEIQESKFPLHVQTMEFSNGIEIVCDYFAGRFSRETIERILAIYLHYLDKVTGRGDETLRSIAQIGTTPRLARRPAGVAAL